MDVPKPGELDWRMRRIARFSQANDRKILFVVIDGLGGLPHPDHENRGLFDDKDAPPTPKSELEWASLKGKLENLNAFVRSSNTVTGRVYPVGKGFTPGCIAGHLGLFGYDADHYIVKRGPAESAAMEGRIEPGDIVARINFCQIDSSGRVVDRRAGRLRDPARGQALASKIEKNLSIQEAKVQIIATVGHRGLLILRRASTSDAPLSEHICNTDPGAEDKPLIECRSLRLNDKAALRTARLVNKFCEQTREILSDEPDANMVVLRGVGTRPALPHFSDVYNLNAAAVAAYPAYKGLASLLGMAVLGDRPGHERLCTGEPFGKEIEILKQFYSDYDFFFVHYKLPDEKGEDKDFFGKVEAIHQFDRHFPRLQECGFDVTVITGDHATPSLLGRHSHHSVPLAIQSGVMKGYDRTQEFTEPSCLHGARGFIDGPELMSIVLGNAGKLRKFDW